MKKIFIGLLLAGSFLTGFSQESNTSKIISFAEVEEPPFHKDCNDPNDYSCSLEKISRYLSKEFDLSLYKQDIANFNFKMKFIIDEKGKVAWIKVLSDNRAVNEEAEKLMKEMPAFTPGMHKGEKVSVMYLIPITLRYRHRFPGTYTIDEVDTSPVLKKCKEKEDLFKCLTLELSNAINQNYNFNYVPDGVQTAAVCIEIDDKGNISDFLIVSESKALKKGLKHVKAELPEFESGAILNGKKVKTTVNLPVTIGSQSYK